MYAIIKKIFIEIMNKKIRVLNYSQKFVIIKNTFIEIMSKNMRVLKHIEKFMSS